MAFSPQQRGVHWAAELAVNFESNPSKKSAWRLTELLAVFQVILENESPSLVAALIGHLRETIFGEAPLMFTRRFFEKTVSAYAMKTDGADRLSEHLQQAFVGFSTLGVKPNNNGNVRSTTSSAPTSTSTTAGTQERSGCATSPWNAAWASLSTETSGNLSMPASSDCQASECEAISSKIDLPAFVFAVSPLRALKRAKVWWQSLPRIAAAVQAGLGFVLRGAVARSLAWELVFGGILRGVAGCWSLALERVLESRLPYV